MFYSITFAPAFERERRFRNDGNVDFYGSFGKKTFSKKNFRKHLAVTIKSLTFASAFGNDGKT